VYFVQRVGGKWSIRILETRTGASGEEVRIIKKAAEEKGSMCGRISIMNRGDPCGNTVNIVKTRHEVAWADTQTSAGRNCCRVSYSVELSAKAHTRSVSARSFGGELTSVVYARLSTCGT